MKVTKSRLKEIIQEEYDAMAIEERQAQGARGVGVQAGNVMVHVGNQIKTIAATYQKIGSALQQNPQAQVDRALKTLAGLAQGLITMLGGQAAPAAAAPKAPARTGPAPATISLGTQHARRVATLNEAGTMTQSEITMSTIRMAIEAAIGSQLGSVVEESEIKTLVDNATSAVEGRIKADLAAIYDEVAGTVTEVVMMQEPGDVIEELKALASQLSSVTDNAEPVQGIVQEIISQINDLEELLIMEVE
tara:strand:+ start:2975 stop:3718 length:744 start_codon:yes stop_codon:yes gene_type:complete